MKNDQDLVLFSYRMLSHIRKTKKPFTLAEEVRRPALYNVTEQLFDKKTEGKLQSTLLSDTTASRREFHMAENLLQQLKKNENAPFYGLQFNELTDVGN